MFDIITIEETWLDEITEKLVAIPGYTFISKPKQPSKIGGGLGIFIKDELSYELEEDILKIKDNSKYDGLFVKIENEKCVNNINLGVFYRSPSFDSITEFTEILDSA